MDHLINILQTDRYVHVMSVICHVESFVLYSYTSEVYSRSVACETYI